MEKSWEQIAREVDAMHAHEAFSEKLIFALIALAVLVGLFHGPAIWAYLWVLPTFGYLGGRHAVETLHYPFSDYWLLSLGSQAVLALMVGVPLLIRFGF